MAYDETLAARIRRRLARRKNIAEKKMFGGIGFLLNGNIMVGVWKDSLFARVGPEKSDAALKEAFVREIDITGGTASNFCESGSCQPHDVSPKLWTNRFEVPGDTGRAASIREMLDSGFPPRDMKDAILRFAALSSLTPEIALDHRMNPRLSIPRFLSQQVKLKPFAPVKENNYLIGVFA